MERHGNPERLQPLDEIVPGGVLVSRAGLAYQRFEAIQQRARFVEPNRRSRGRFQGVIGEQVEHVSLPRCEVQLDRRRSADSQPASAAWRG